MSDYGTVRGVLNTLPLDPEAWYPPEEVARLARSHDGSLTVSEVAPALRLLVSLDGSWEKRLVPLSPGSKFVRAEYRRLTS